MKIAKRVAMLVEPTPMSISEGVVLFSSRRARSLSQKLRNIPVIVTMAATMYLVGAWESASMNGIAAVMIKLTNVKIIAIDSVVFIFYYPPKKFDLREFKL